MCEVSILGALDLVETGRGLQSKYMTLTQSFDIGPGVYAKYMTLTQSFDLGQGLSSKVPVHNLDPESSDLERGL